MSNKTTRAIIWTAVSTISQASDDKESLPTQEAEGRALCESRGWHIVDVLTVPGHSRRYTDIYKCAADMRANQIYAYDKLLEHWERRDFDVLVVRDGNRFARTQSLHARVVEDTFEAGAWIYSFMDGEITEKNMRMFISMNSYKAAAEIDELQRRREIGYDARARRGLPVNSKVADSHKLIRDPVSGKAIKVVVDESQRRKWLDAAELVLKGLPWSQIEDIMFNQYGHANQWNEPYKRLYFYRVFYTPSFWGHVARHFKYEKRGQWVLEAGHDIPEGVTINYNVHEPVFTGEFAERLKAELVRREEVIKGRASSRDTYRFTGLFICGDCGYALSYHKDVRYTWLRCYSKYEVNGVRASCDSRRYLREDRAQVYVDAVLQKAIQLQNPSVLLTAEEDTQATERAISNVQTELMKLELRLRGLIRDRAVADEALRAIYDGEVQQNTEHLKVLQSRLRELQAAAMRLAPPRTQARAFEELVELGLEQFWRQEDRVINQLLHRLMGNRRFVVKDGEIVGTAYAHRRGRRRF